jgi:hypothetical protein
VLLLVPDAHKPAIDKHEVLLSAAEKLRLKADKRTCWSALSNKALHDSERDSPRMVTCRLSSECAQSHSLNRTLRSAGMFARCGLPPSTMSRHSAHDYLRHARGERSASNARIASVGDPAGAPGTSRSAASGCPLHARRTRHHCEARRERAAPTGGLPRTRTISLDEPSSSETRNT